MRAAPRRFELDSETERSVRALRLFAALAVSVAALWILTGHPGTLGWLVALLGLLVAAGWTAAWALSRRRTTASPGWFLELAVEGMLLAEGGRRLHVSWSDVRCVDVDEERLVVRIGRAGDSPVIVEPRYGGVSVYDLQAAIEDAWHGATGGVRD